MNQAIRNTLLAAPVLWSTVLTSMVGGAIASEPPSPQPEAHSTAEAIEPVETSQTVLELAESTTESTVASLDQWLAGETTAAESIEPVETHETDLEPAEAAVSSLEQIQNYAGHRPIAAETESMSQLTSITQLSDVQPTDWAYQALQSLVERYGCIAGYPDGTYKGQRALTRYEFAAGLNACLDRISELVASSTADLATKEDLATLQRLQEEFAAELATLRGRVDSLEARVSELEANQFSTTTRLVGETLFAVAVPIEGDYDDDDDDGAAFIDDQVIAGYRARLTLLTSFTGDDELRTRIQATDFNNFYAFGGAAGQATTWHFSQEAPGSGADGDIVLNDLWYKFPIGERITVTLGANNYNNVNLVTSPISPFQSSGTGSLMRFGRPPQYLFYPSNTGAGVNIEILDGLFLDAAYSASNDAFDPTPGDGLFNGNYGAVAQLTFLSDFLDAALTYVNTYNDAGFFSGLDVNDDDAVDAPEIANIYAGQVNFKFGSLQVGGGAMYMPVRAIEVGDYDAWSFQLTLAINDFGGDGNRLGILAGITPYASSVPEELGDRINQDNNILVEASYLYNFNDNIAVQPAFIVLTAPDNEENNDTTFVAALRTIFRF